MTKGGMSTVKIVAAVLVALIAASFSGAQVINVTNRTSTPVPGSGHDYLHLLNETVNPANGSVSVRIGLPMPPGRGLSLPYAFGYDSNGIFTPFFYNRVLTIAPSYQLTGGGAPSGWTDTIPSLTFSPLTTTVPDIAGGAPHQCPYDADYMFSDLSGTRHALHLELLTGGDPACDVALGNVTLGGDDFVQATIDIQHNVRVADADGTVSAFSAISTPDLIEDRNGNKLTFTSNPSTFSVTDTLGRTVLSTSRAGNQTTVTVSGLPAPYIIQWGTAPTSFCIQTLGSQGQAGSACEGTTTVPVIQSIALPNGTQYTFHYDPVYGLLDKITYPTGGWVKYTWGLNPLSEVTTYVPATTAQSVSYRHDWPAIVQRQVSFDGVNPALQQDFTYTTGSWTTVNYLMWWGSKQTTVKTTDLVTGQVSYAVYSYLGQNVGNNDPIGPAPAVQEPMPIEQTIAYQDAGHNTLRTVNKTWFDANLLQSEQTVENGQSSLVTYAYEPAGSIILRLKEKDEYDFGQSAPSRKMVTNYQTFGITPLFSQPSILDQPSSVITCNTADPCTTTSSNRVAETDYAYDQSSVTNVINLIGHDDAQYGTGYNNRGNATTITRKCFPSCSDAATTYAYDITGQVLTMKDPNGQTTGAVTQYSYTDSYTEGGTPPGNTNAYLTTVTYPQTNGVAHIERFAYAYSDGQLTSSTDQNGATAGDPAHTTVYSYNDPLRRLKSVTGPPDPNNSGQQSQTIYNYHDGTTAYSTTLEVRQKIDTRQSSSLTNFDGLGRAARTEKLNGEDASYPYDQVDTCFNGLGQKYFGTYPYRSSGFDASGVGAPYVCSNSQRPGDALAYDIFGRVTQVTSTDGSVVNTDYSQFPVVKVTDQAGKQRKSFSDGLGRLIRVDEPTSNPPTIATGSITISGNEGSVQILTQAARPGTGSVSISGGNNSWPDPDMSHCYYDKYGFIQCPYLWDNGHVFVTVNGLSKTAYFSSQSDTGSTLAYQLASAFNSDGASPMTASTSGATLYMQARQPGAATNYSLSAGAASDYPISPFYPNAGFTPTVSGSTLTGGQDAQYTTVYDTGTVSASVTVSGNPFSKSVNYGQYDTPSSIAVALANAFHADINSPVDASSSGGTITLTSKVAGRAGNYPISVASATTNTAYFSGPSFQPNTSGAISGGLDSGLDQPATTLYAYDALDNLIHVEQHGADPSPANWRQRSFQYNSLSQLTQAANPESGTINYSYDNNGNLFSKTSPAPNQTGGATISYQYGFDALNRLLLRSSTTQPSQPNETYTYDLATVTTPPVNNPVGRLVKANSAASAGNVSTIYSYDVMGRKEYEIEYPNRSNSALSKTFSYTYNLDSSLNSITYPSGRVVNYSYNVAQRPTSAVDRGGTNFAASAHYTAWGALSSLANGTNLNSTNIYDNRMQPCRLTSSSAGFVPGSCQDSTNTGNVLDLVYDFKNGQADNGNVYGITNKRASPRSQTFQYDPVNRLLSATSANWSENYVYDPWGNLLKNNAVGGDAVLNVTVNPKNQVTAWCYDAAGNIVGSSVCPSFTNVYDGENRMIAATVGAVTTTYDYDAAGLRVKKSGPTNTLYWHGAGEVLEETDLGGGLVNDYVFFGGKRTARVDALGAVHYYFSDHLGSADVITNANGGTIEEESDYYPFGGERALVAGPNHYKFTGKERDPETGCDYFGARYYCNTIGRFITPDWADAPTAVPYANFGNPQSLNLYSYVKNNPTTFGDPDGHCPGVITCTLVGLAEGGLMGAAEGLAIGIAITGPPIAATYITANTPANVNTAPYQMCPSPCTVLQASQNQRIAESQGQGIFQTDNSSQGGQQHGSTQQQGSGQQQSTNSTGGMKQGSAGGPGAGKKTTPEQREPILKENGGKCVVPGCKEKAEHVDHAIARSRNGDTTSVNLQGMCAHHNCQKGKMSTAEYLQWRKDHPENK